MSRPAALGDDPDDPEALANKNSGQSTAICHDEKVKTQRKWWLILSRPWTCPGWPLAWPLAGPWVGRSRGRSLHAQGMFLNPGNNINKSNFYQNAICSCTTIRLVLWIRGLSPQDVTGLTLSKKTFEISSTISIFGFAGCSIFNNYYFSAGCIWFQYRVFSSNFTVPRLDPWN